MGFAKRYWKQALCSVGGAWLFLSSIFLAAIGLVTNHMFLKIPYSPSEWITNALIVIQVFPIVSEPTSSEAELSALLVLLSKGWAIGFGACHLYRRSLRFENKWVALGWYFCAFSLVISAIMLLMFILQLPDSSRPRLPSDAISVAIQTFFLSASLLIPFGLVLGIASFFRLLSAKGKSNSENSGGFDKGSNQD